MQQLQWYDLERVGSKEAVARLHCSICIVCDKNQMERYNSYFTNDYRNASVFKGTVLPLGRPLLYVLRQFLKFLMGGSVLSS